jgi:DNA polymerase-1
MDGTKKKIPRYQNAIYKSKRQLLLPEIFIQAYKDVEWVCEAIGLNFVRHEDMEADDVIASIVYFDDQDYEMIVFSEDKDLLQIPREFKLISYKLEERKNRELLGNIGLTDARQMTCYLSLMGDSSDSIPGVPKIGPKKALNMIMEHGSLLHILKHLRNAENKDTVLVKRGIRELIASYRMVTLRYKKIRFPKSQFFNKNGAIDFIKHNKCYNQIELVELLNHAIL